MKNIFVILGYILLAVISFQLLVNRDEYTQFVLNLVSLTALSISGIWFIKSKPRLIKPFSFIVLFLLSINLYSQKIEYIMYNAVNEELTEIYKDKEVIVKLKRGSGEMPTTETTSRKVFTTPDYTYVIDFKNNTQFPIIKSIQKFNMNGQELFSQGIQEEGGKTKNKNK